MGKIMRYMTCGFILASCASVARGQSSGSIALPPTMPGHMGYSPPASPLLEVAPVIPMLRQPSVADDDMRTSCQFPAHLHLPEVERPFPGAMARECGTAFTSPNLGLRAWSSAKGVFAGLLALIGTTLGRLGRILAGGAKEKQP
jgi:hypothetical protein